MRLDGRIPVRLLDVEAGPADRDATALLRIGDALPPPGPGWAVVIDLPAGAALPHEANCRCCSGRSGLAAALGSLFAQRARGEVPFFRQAVVQARNGRIHDLFIVLRDDALVSGRYRMER